MVTKIALGACGAMLVAVLASSTRSGAQTAPQGKGAQLGQYVTSPCVGGPNSVECAIYRLNQIDRRIDGLQTAVSELQSRPNSRASGPPVSPLQGGEGKADASFDYVMKRLDQLATKVTDLVIKVNMQ